MYSHLKIITQMTIIEHPIMHFNKSVSSPLHKRVSCLHRAVSKRVFFNRKEEVMLRYYNCWSCLLCKQRSSNIFLIINDLLHSVSVCISGTEWLQLNFPNNIIPRNSENRHKLMVQKMIQSNQATIMNFGKNRM